MSERTREEDSMDNFPELLGEHIATVEAIADKIEAGEAYIDDMRAYIPSLSQMITTLYQLADEGVLQIDQEFIMRVLADILSGIENEDTVLLLDVLRYGLLEIYDYIAAELQKEGTDE